MKITCIVLSSLAIASSAFSATISLIASGTITNEWLAAFPTAQTGDEFTLSVSYTDELPDLSQGFNPGFISPDDLTVTLDIIGKGVAFDGVGGSISVATRCSILPGGQCYPAITITSPSFGGPILTLLLGDENHSTSVTSGFPIDFDSVGEYEAMEFYIHPSFPDNSSGASLNGSISLLVVPEPGVGILASLSILMVMGRRRRPANQPTPNKTRHSNHH